MGSELARALLLRRALRLLAPTDRMTITAIFAALLMGFVLGLLGGGGSILAVPILVFLLGVPAKSAIATSLLVVGATSIVAAIGHARAGHVAWRTGLVFGGFSMLGAFMGGRLAAFIPGNVLLIAFGVLMLGTAVAMLRAKPRSGAAAAAASEARSGTAPLPVAKIALEGVVVGAVTGLIGAGGGFLVVPALALLGGLSMRHAIGTSLVVIAMKSFAGFAGYATHAEVDLGLVLGFVGASVVGTLLGARAARAIDADRLRRAFAYFVLSMGAFILTEKAGLLPNARALPEAHGPAEEQADAAPAGAQPRDVASKPA
jgi:uncharacterized membrane protein YfcA